MKKILPVILFGLSIITLQAQLITGFGTSETNPVNTSSDFFGGWSGTSNATSLTVTSVSNQSGGIFSTLVTPVALTGSSLKIDGTLLSLTAGAADHFQIALYDSLNHTLLADYAWSSFTGGGSSTVSLTAGSGVFNGTVTSWELHLYGGVSETVSFTFDGMSAVPEPTSLLLLGMGLAGIAMRRSLRRR